MVLFKSLLKIEMNNKTFHNLLKSIVNLINNNPELIIKVDSNYQEALIFCKYKSRELSSLTHMLTELVVNPIHNQKIIYSVELFKMIVIISCTSQDIVYLNNKEIDTLVSNLVLWVGVYYNLENLTINFIDTVIYSIIKMCFNLIAFKESLPEFILIFYIRISQLKIQNLDTLLKHLNECLFNIPNIWSNTISNSTLMEFSKLNLSYSIQIICCLYKTYKWNINQNERIELIKILVGILHKLDHF